MTDIINGVNTCRTEVPICPYCGREQVPVFDLSFEGDEEGSIMVRCKECCRYICIAREIVFVYITTKE